MHVFHDFGSLEIRLTYGKTIGLKLQIPESAAVLQQGLSYPKELPK